MKRKCTQLCLVLLFFCMHLFAQNKSNLWTKTSESALDKTKDVFAKNYKPAAFIVFQLDEAGMKAMLKKAPSEKSISVSKSAFIISVPNAKGEIEKFKVVEAPVMQAGLAAKHPDIKSYAGQGIDEPSSSIRFDMTPEGFHGMILSAVRKTIYINPVNKNNKLYVVFDRDNLRKDKDVFDCQFDKLINGKFQGKPFAKNADDSKLRTFRLALAVNGEFTQETLDGTETTDAEKKAKALAAMTADLVRANGIYERDFGIRMQFVDLEDTLIYIDPKTDPFTTASGWNSQIQTTCDKYIGNANYDVGHLIARVKNTGLNNGNAGCIACVCKTGQKGSGFTAHTDVTGDPLVVDYWTHEMGHQFGGWHTFTFSSEAVYGNIAQMEPGSGSTIMGYAGITGSTDVQPHSDDYFHGISIQQITDYVQTGKGATCAVVTETGDNAPTADAGSDYIIPKSTPFELTGAGTDDDEGDVLSYDWEQFDNLDVGTNTFPDPTATTGPVVRSILYSTNPVRTLPQLSSVLDGTNGNLWEALPSVQRDLNFRLTVRDNHADGGQNNSDDMKVSITADAGPFKVKVPNTAITWEAGNFTNVTWDVANTNKAPVNCAAVKIELSTDGGFSFPIVLADNTPNDGTEEIYVPSILTDKARIRIKSVGNIFFDISDNNFTIAEAAVEDFVFNNPAAVVSCTGINPSILLKTGSLHSYTSPINLSATGNPGGTTVSFSNNPVTPGSDVTVTLIGTAPAGTYIITIKGESGSITKERNVAFTVGAPATSAALIAPANLAIGQSLLPLFIWNSNPAAESYLLEISQSPTFATIEQTVDNITDTFFKLIVPLTENTEYYWRVTTKNNCGNGVASSANHIKTSHIECSEYASTDVPKVIPTTVATVVSLLEVPATGAIEDVNVIGLKGKHTWIHDLKFTLTSPSATSVVLFDQICSNEDNFDLNLDDEASTDEFPCPPKGGVTVKPQEPLAAFKDEPANGTWTLTVNDKVSLDGGKLLGWGLTICVGIPTTLPVSWINFTAERAPNNASVVLKWATANETNNDHFDIERSSDAVNFHAITSIAAGSRPNTVQYYLYNDNKPLGGISYYRLKQVDKDGKYKYSEIRKVSIDQSANLLTIYPNPVHNKATIHAYTNLSNVSIQLANAAGKIVYTKNISAIANGEVLEIPVINFAKGIYILTIKSDKINRTEKLVVQ